MLTQQQLQEIRTALEDAKNPLFFFDDDTDGLTSFLVLYRKYRKGHGIPVKAPHTEENLYLRKIAEYNPDLVLILDRPVLPQSLINQMHVPLVWIDHHEPLDRQGVKYYNPLVAGKKDNRPTSYWCYKVVGQDLWIALIGIIGDWHVPKELLKNFPYRELLGKAKKPDDILFETEFGHLIKIFNFVLNGRTTEVKKLIAVLSKIESPLEILQQTTVQGKIIYHHAEKIKREYERMLHQALQQQGKEHVYVFVSPESQRSFTRVLSNEVLHRLNYKLFIIAREKSGDMRLSLRGKKTSILPILKKVLERVPGYGGGHDMACGATVKKEHFQRFVEEMRKELKLSLKKPQSKTIRASAM